MVKPMNQDELKALVAQEAVKEVLNMVKSHPKNIPFVIGIGTGSTANLFIDALAPHRELFAGAVSSSEASAARLEKHGFVLMQANDIEFLPVYVDGADEIDPQGNMLKGGGGALTREKIIAQLAKTFICICDDTKAVKTLGAFPLPVEVIPLAYQQVSRELTALGARITLRVQKGETQKTFMTDNAAWIIDVHGLRIDKPAELESWINQIPGVICNGIFARRKADILLMSNSLGVTHQEFKD